MTTVERGLTLHRYWDRASCQACALKPQCTPSAERRVTRSYLFNPNLKRP